MRVRTARPSARLLIVDPEHNLLLFYFDAGDGRQFWATPGGACDPGENYFAAARREMFEETGLMLDPGPEVHQRRVEFTSLEGEQVWSDERYFFIKAPDQTLNKNGHTELEQRVITNHRWWSLSDLDKTIEQVFPDNITNLVRQLLENAG